MTERTRKQVDQIAERMRHAALASRLAALLGPQLAHDLSVLLGAQCDCARRDDEHEHDPEQPPITKE